jgi:hypothetical protein
MWRKLEFLETGSWSGTMKKLAWMVAAWMLAGCVSGSRMPHDDSLGAVQQSGGPALCRDGTTLPCNDRD